MIKLGGPIMSKGRDERREFITRWLPARRMFMEGKSTKDIAEVYKLPEKSMADRMSKFRQKYGWFIIVLEDFKIGATL